MRSGTKPMLQRQLGPDARALQALAAPAMRDRLDHRQAKAAPVRDIRLTPMRRVARSALVGHLDAQALGHELGADFDLSVRRCTGMQYCVAGQLARHEQGIFPDRVYL